MVQTKKIILSILVTLILITSFSISGNYITNNRDTKVDPDYMEFTPIILDDSVTKIFDSEKINVNYKKDTDVFYVLDKTNNYSFKTGIDQLTEKYTYRELDNYLSLSEEEKENKSVPKLSTLSDTFINRANSVLAVTYFDDNLTVQNLESASRDVIKTYNKSSKLDNVFSINYQFSEVDLSILVVFTFVDNNITVQIPDSEIKGEAENRINNISVFPFLGAAGGANYKYIVEENDYDYDTIEKDSSTTGYSVIPDSSGALVRFVENTSEFKRIELPVYGLDPSINFLADNNKSPYNLDKRASMPMFGIVHGSDQNAFLAYAEEGDENMTIVSEPYGLNDVYYNYTYARFDYNQKYFQVYNEVGNGSTVIRNDRNHFDVSLTYSFISGSQANYIGIADAYKEYISSNLSLKDVTSSEIPIRLDFLLSDATSAFIGYNDTVVTSVDDVRYILNDVEKSGIYNINSGLIGYQSGGSTLQSLTSVKYESSIGSKNSFKDLISDFASKGIDISFSNNNLMINSEQTSLNGNASKHIGGTYNEITDNTLGNEDIKTYNYLKSSKVNTYTNKQVSSIVDTVNPLSTTISGISSLLVSDNGDSRLKAKSDYITTFSDVENKVKINAESPNSYLWPYITRYLNASAFNSQYLFETDSIPLISYILRDFMEVYSDYSNFSFYDLTSQLRMIDYNIYPSFVLTNDSSHLLINSNSNNYFSTEYSLYKEKINEIYSRVNKSLSEVINASWIDREVLTDGVILNSYSNNKKIIINYRDSSYNYKGINVSPLSSLVVE